MEYQIALSPKLGLTPVDFVQSWNASSEAQAFAEARLTSTSNASYNPFLDGTMVVLSTIGTIGVGVATNLLSDRIKEIFTKKTPQKHLHITKVDLPDGTHILVVDSKEE